MGARAAPISPQGEPDAATVAADTAPAPGPTTYRLHIRVAALLTVTVGRLGTFAFPAGDYVYTGSARRNLEARVARHCRRATAARPKPLRWHIDYLLARPEAAVVRVERLCADECAANQAMGGTVPAPGFGASDCAAGCISHLRYLGPGEASPAGR